MRPDVDHVTLVIDVTIGVRVVHMVGPTVWTVLQGLAVHTTPVGRHRQARTNVRELAAELGVSKDTVARSLNKLIDAKIIRRSDAAHDAVGRFTARTYDVDLAKAGLRVVHDSQTPALDIAEPLTASSPPALDAVALRASGVRRDTAADHRRPAAGDAGTESGATSDAIDGAHLTTGTEAQPSLFD